MLALLLALAVADPPPKAGDYATAVAQAQADLDAGRVAEAQTRLAATDPAARGFEYRYLVARARSAAPGKPAGDLVRTVPNPKVESRYGVLSPDGKEVVFVCRDGGLRVHDLAAPDAPSKTVAHPDGGAVWSGVFSHDGTTFAAGHESGEVVVWDAATWKRRLTVSLGEKWPVRELAVAPDGSAVVAEGKAALELWSLAGDKASKVAAVGERYNFGEGLAFSPAGDRIATGGMFDIVVHDAKTGKPIQTLRHASYTMGLEFSPDGRRIASAPRGNVNRFLAVFDLAAGKAVFNAGPLPAYVAGLAFTPDGKRVVATGPIREVRLYDAAGGEVLLALKRGDHTARPAVSRDGRVLGWSEPGGYRVIDLGAGK